MIRTEFHDPNGEIINNISIEQMKKYILNQFPEYWNQGSGDGYIDYFENDFNKYTLMIGANENYGIYIRYIDNENDEEWLSLQDVNNLDNVVETADEIYASIGLFLPIEVAFSVIKEFILTGNKTNKITWVRPDIIPENGNY